MDSIRNASIFVFKSAGSPAAAASLPPVQLSAPLGGEAMPGIPAAAAPSIPAAAAPLILEAAPPSGLDAGGNLACP